MSAIDSYEEISFSIIIGDAVRNYNEMVECINFPRKKINWRFEKAPLNIERICFPCPPLGCSLTRFVMWKPASISDATVFFSNKRDGWTHMLKHYSGMFSKKMFNVTICFRKGKDTSGFFFYLVNEGEIERAIHAINDIPRWVFYEEGKQLSFENPEYYHRRRKRDRINREIITEYLNACGWDIDDPSFWEANIAYYGEQVAWDWEVNAPTS